MNDNEITLEQLRNAQGIAARIVAEHGEQYLPVFLRLEEEIAARTDQESALQRALKLAS